MKQRYQTGYFTLFLFLALNAIQLQSQISTQETPYGINHQIDISGLKASNVVFTKEILNHNEFTLQPHMLAGVSLPVHKSFYHEAERAFQSDSGTLWQMKITIAGASRSGFVFSDFFLHAGDKFFIYSENKKHYIGAFTERNNGNGYFSTHILPGETFILEYFSRDHFQDHPPQIMLDEVIYLFNEQELHSITGSDKSSGACNVNVNCPEGQMWQKQKRGVARILLRSGSTWFNCTGSLINTTLSDGSPYFLTSDHCGVSASDDDLQVWQFYFNYEYAGCSNTGGAPQNMMISGASIVARAPISQGSDFKLLELNQAPLLSWNPYYNGWSRSSRNPEWGVGIHHPSGDAKKISTFTTPLHHATFTGGMQQGYWRVAWRETESGHGVTEGGSSGSPIFDEHGLITGTLTGGGASCNNPTLPDYYGKFYRHWNANGDTPDKTLQPWLDPEGDNPEQLFGYDPNAITNFVLVDINPPLAGLVTGDGYYAENESVSLLAIPNSGYKFLNWTNDSGSIVGVDSTFDFIMPQTEILITANFADIENTIGLHAVLQKTKIYPNPARNYLWIEFDESLLADTLTLTLYNLQGQKVQEIINQKTSEPLQVRINTQMIPEGVYILTIRTEEVLSAHRIIITH